MSGTGNITGGNLNATGLSLSGNVVSAINTTSNVTTTANISANYFLGNGSQLSGIITSVANINNGDSNVSIATPNANVTVSVNGTSNVAVFSDTGEYVTGLISASGNITGGNIKTGGLISATGNVTGGNLLTGGAISAGGNITATGNIYAVDANFSHGAYSNAQITDRTQLATKFYVDNQVAAGINIHDPVVVATTGNLIATYTPGGTTPTWTDIVDNKTLVTSSPHGLTTNDQITFYVTTNGVVANLAYFVYDTPNATSITLSEIWVGPQITNLTNGTGLSITSRAKPGVGATLTNAGTQTVLALDGVNLSVNDRVLVKDQATGSQNGIYVVTDIGSGSSDWILTRSSDTNQFAPQSSQGLSAGDYVYVSGGLTEEGNSYVEGTNAYIIIGTTSLIYTQFSGHITYTGVNPITITGQTISLAATTGTGSTVVLGASPTLVTPNIGAANGTSLSVTGNVIGGNVTTSGIISAGSVSSSGNVIGGNVLYGTGQVSGTGNIYANNIAATNQISATGNIIGNLALYVGAGATTAGLTNPIIVAQAPGLAYVQVAAKNTLSTGSADFVAYANNSTETAAWTDMGMTGSGFNDTAYTITGANDGYVFVQGNTDGTGGLLVLATGENGDNPDIVFATGGFLSTDEKMRFIHATGQFDIETTTAAANTITGALRVRGGAGIAGNIYAGGLVSVTGNILTTSNVSGGNLLTGGEISAGGNINGGNLSISGNITGGNVLTGGAVSAAANVIGGNVLTGGVVSASGNVTGNYLLGNARAVTGVTLANTVTDVILTSPQPNQILEYNGSEWVNADNTSTVSAGQGSGFWVTTPVIIAASVNNFNQLDTLSPTPNTSAQSYASATINGTGIISGSRSAALGRTTVDAGNWDFSIWANINATGGTSTLLATMHSTTPFPLSGTVTLTGTGTSRTVTASADAPFANSTTGGGNVALSSYVETPTGLFPITAIANSTSVTVAVPTTYTNESAVNGYTWDPLFHVGSTTLSGTAISEYLFGTTQPAYAISNTAGIALLMTGITTQNKTIYITINGSNQSTHIATPLHTLHNDLAGLQGGQSTEYYHLTSTEYTGTGTGVFARASSPVLTTPNIGAAVGTSLSTTGNISTGAAVNAVGNVSGNYFIGNGALLTGISSSSYGDSNVAAYLPTYTGNLVSLTGPVVTTANITGGNISTGGIVSATGNITSIANISGGNVLSSDLIQGVTLSASGNVNGGNLTTSQQISATGNVTGGNVITAGAVSAGSLSVTGNVTGGNLSIVGNVVTGGNITTNNPNANLIIDPDGTGYAIFTATTPVIIANASGIALSVAGNITGGNIIGTFVGDLTGTTVSVTGNITGGNLNAAGLSLSSNVVSGMNVTGNIAGGNITTPGLISSTGNISGGNVIVTGIIVDNTGNLELQSAATNGNVNLTPNGVGIVGVSTSLSVTGNITGGNVLGGANVNATTHTGATVSVTGNITGGGDLSLTGNIVDTGPLTILTSSNGNITLSPNGTGNINTGANIMPTANATSNIGSATLSYNTIFAKATSAQYADLAELYQADATYPPGTVLIFGGEYEVTAQISNHSSAIAGVVSENPSHLMNAGLQGKHIAAVALLGRVPCQVQGTICKGDLLVASNTPGVAQRLNIAQYTPGCIIGKSLENYDSDGVGTIEIAVGVK